MVLVFFFNDTATTEIYTLSLQRRSSDLRRSSRARSIDDHPRQPGRRGGGDRVRPGRGAAGAAEDQRVQRSVDARSEEHTSELQSRQYLVCRLLLEKKKDKSVMGISMSSV